VGVLAAVATPLCLGYVKDATLPRHLGAEPLVPGQEVEDQDAGGGGRDRACMSVLAEAVGALEHAGIPFPERVVYGQERAPR